MGQCHLLLRRTEIECLVAQHTACCYKIDSLIRRFCKHGEKCAGQGFSVHRQGAGVILGEELLIPPTFWMDMCLQSDAQHCVIGAVEDVPRHAIEPAKDCLLLLAQLAEDCVAVPNALLNLSSCGQSSQRGIEEMSGSHQGDCKPVHIDIKQVERWPVPAAFPGTGDNVVNEVIDLVDFGQEC